MKTQQQRALELVLDPKEGSRDWRDGALALPVFPCRFLLPLSSRRRHLRPPHHP